MSSTDMIPQYDTKLFTEVFEDADSFVYTYQHIGLPQTISAQNARTLYYLLYARYGNNPIANYDEEQFKYKVFSIVFQYGPTWEKRLSVQETLRGLQLSDLIDDGGISELFAHSGSSSKVANGVSGNTRTYEEDGTDTGTSAVAHTGTSALARTGTQALTKTGTVSSDHDVETVTDEDTTASGLESGTNIGTSTVSRTGTQSLAKTGTDTVASTGTQSLEHTGTVSVDHDNTVSTDNEVEDIKNHAFNPGTAPATDAYSPLSYVNEQNANKNVLDGQSVQNETNVTAYANADTTTNNLQNQTTHATTDTTTNNLTDATTNEAADSKTTSGSGTKDATVVTDESNVNTYDTTDTTTNDLTDTTTNNLTDTTTNNLASSKDGKITDSGSTSDSVLGEDSANDSMTRTLTQGKLKAYEKLLELLDADVTGDFISKFKVCFKQFVIPERTWIYVTEED